MQVSSEVLSVLSAARVEGESLFLVGQLDRKLYEQTNKVLEAAGGKWNRKARAHVFEAPAADRVDQIILSGSVDVPKDEFNFFPTPAALVQELLELAEISPGMRVLEPSAGKGAIAYACAEAGAVVDCYELMDANFAALAGDVRLGVVRHMDFLAQEQEASFDRVVMNPPFAKQADIKHVTHALGFLRQGGRLVAVMSAGVVFRSDSRPTAFRDLVEARGGSIQPNPAGSFKESGTLVNTVTVVIPA
jgi:predicted RNA methylase